jgi:hypothetical protein
VCTKCKLQLGQHLIDNKAQNEAAASNISPSSAHIHQQCHNFDMDDSLYSNVAQNFDFLSSNELIKLQNQMHPTNKPNLINGHTDNYSEQFNQNNSLDDLIDTLDNELFLINESLHQPLLSIVNKLLGK